MITAPFVRCARVARGREVNVRHTVTGMGSSPTGSRSRRGRGRPRGGDPAATRERVLAAAADLFAEQGYRATSMSAVADAAGLSQTGLLHHFGSKEDLLAGVLERRDEEDVAAIMPDFDPSRGWVVLDQLIRIVERNTTREPFVRLFTAMAGEAIDPDHPGHAWLRRHHEDISAMIVDGLRAAVADGTARPTIPVERVAHVTVAVLDGLQIQWLMDPAGVDMLGDFTAYVDTVRAQWGTATD